MVAVHGAHLLVRLLNSYLQEEDSRVAGGSLVAGSSVSLLPPPQEALQGKTLERKYYSGKCTTMTCTSQERVTLLCPRPFKWSPVEDNSGLLSSACLRLLPSFRFFFYFSGGVRF